MRFLHNIERRQVKPSHKAKEQWQTSDFQAGLQTLVGLAQQKQVALMCAEAVPWRCHRSLFAEALLVRGFRSKRFKAWYEPVDIA